MEGNFTFLQPEARISAESTHLLAWNVPPKDLKQIPEHWLTYEEPEASLHYLLGLVYIMFTVAALTGNGLVLWVFGSAPSLRTPSNVFVVNLALCDFMMMLKAPIFIYNSFNRGFATGVLGCQIFAAMGSLSGIGAGMTNACIAYDRFNVITRPFHAKMTRLKAILIVLLVWGYTIPWTVLPLMELWGRFVPEGYLTSCSFDYLTDTFDNHLFVGAIFVCSYMIPMSMIIYFYSQIVSHVVNHEKTLREQARKMNVDSLRSNTTASNQTAEIRIAKAAITICFLFVASWTPYGVMALIGAFGDKRLLTPGVTMIPACCCKLVACIDPWIYAISHPKYRLELQRKLPWLAIHEKEISDSASVTSVATTEVTQNAEQVNTTTT
ncbi:opsin, ultraviolet-sensitive-like [Lutzomyia longipalpis]|uniref:opsin, ultraviolet-sensitive-like n=1 Tax=Lutzomyia longipalpis TaxID=7200 RepID=UPI0024845644|nr:opsin, ultraviolet-sensitive-like [Lutzomyia longipalpis]